MRSGQRKIVIKKPKGKEDRSLFAGRPYSVWRDHPEIARMINDQLASKPPTKH